MEGVDLSLCGGLFWVDCHFIVEGPFIKVDEIRGGLLSFGGAVLGIVPYLSALEAGIVVVVSAWCRLGDAVLRHSPLSPPLVRGSGVAKVHRNRSIVKCRGSRGRVDRRGPVPNGVSICGGVWWGPAPHILLGALEEWLGRLPPLLGVSPIACISSPGVTLIAKHTLDDLAGPGGIDRFLFHLFVSCWEWGFHYFDGNGSGESAEEEVSAFVVSCGVFCETE